LVTFLFTDIEGSTRLAQLLGADYRPVLNEHRRLLRRTFCADGGVELFTEGDSFFFAFRDASAALSSCLAAQRALEAHEWPHPHARPRVRMGLHSGWVEPQGGEYASPEVHRAARIAAAAHGGQVLCSAVTAHHARPLADDAWLRDLGLFRLRGFDGRERLFELVASGLPQGFPRPRTDEAAPHNLPAAITSFVGRDQERARLAELLAQHRLVTVVGAGGAGKTRLAIEVAGAQLDAYPDGLWFVDLASVTDPGLVAVTVAATLGLRPEPGRPVLHTLTEHVAARRLLLVLDTCDAQVAAVASMVADVLTGGRAARVLATSREPLGLPGEVVWRIPPLSLEPARDGGPSDAVALLADRTAAARGGVAMDPAEYPHLARIAARLDGLPLALELAAGRLRVLGAEQLATRLDTELPRGPHDLLDTIDAGREVAVAWAGAAPPAGADPAGARSADPAAPAVTAPAGAAATGADATGGAASVTVPPAAAGATDRHATLQAAVHWSYRTLEPDAAWLLRALSVFVGPVDLATAEWLVAGDPLNALTVLVDKSLLHAASAEIGGAAPAAAPPASPSGAGAPSYTYRMLDPIRAYAARALAEAGEEQTARDRHVAWTLDALQRARLGPDGRPVTLSLYRLDPLADEVRAALHWSVTGGTAQSGLQLVRGLEQWWRERGLAREGRLWLFRLYGRMAETGETADERVLAGAYHVHSLQAGADGEYAEQLRYSQQAEAAARRVGDDGLLARVLAGRGWSLLDLGQPDEAERACRELLAWAADRDVTADALFAVYCLAQLLWHRGAFDEAAELLGAARPAEAARPEVRGRRAVDMLLGMVALARGDLVAAHDHLVVALRSRMAYGFHSRACESLRAMAVRCALGGDPRTAARLFGAVHANQSRLRSQLGGFGDYWAEQEAAVRTALGDAAFDAAYADGSTLSLAKAAAVALAVDQEVPAFPGQDTPLGSLA
jgi:predicted ATPase/class 3 adenylate cyclase